MERHVITCDTCGHRTVATAKIESVQAAIKALEAGKHNGHAFFHEPTRNFYSSGPTQESKWYDQLVDQSELGYYLYINA